MYQYSNSLIRQFPSAVTGNAAVGVQATVYVGETGATASLFESNGTTPKANPVTTDGKGFYSFSLADGDYRIVFSSSQFATLRISVLDGAQIREEFEDLVASNLSFRNEQQAAYDAFVLSQGWDQVGTFAAGFTFTSPNQVGQDSSGNWWRWNGSLPKTVTAGTLPSSDANYKLVGDGVLRSDLAATDSPVLVGGVEAGNIQKDFATVAQMAAFSGFEVGMKCRTYKHNASVVTDWEIVASGSGNLTDRTIAVAGGLYAKIIKGIHNVLSYGAYGNDVNDDRPFFQTAITATGGAIIVPVPAVKYFMTPGLDLTNCTVQGGGKLNCVIRFSSDELDCVVSAGNTVMRDMYIDGGWNGTTAGQLGDLVRVNSASFIGEFHATNLILRNAKQDAMRLSNLGYSSLTDVQSNVTGRIGLHIDGEGTPAKTVTTIKLYGKNRFSDCPNGYGLRVFDGHNCDFTGLICEYTAGIEIAGNNNRSLNFDSVYQEFGSGSNAYTFTGSGQGLSITNNFGGGKAIPNTGNFFDVTIYGNSNFSSIAPIQVNDLRVEAAPETATPAVTGAQNVTAATLSSVPAGLYRVVAAMQTADAGSATLNSSSLLVTISAADSAYQTSTSSYVELTDSRFNAGPSVRLQVQGYLSLDVASNVYVRFGYDLSAGQIAYAGKVTMERVK